MILSSTILYVPLVFWTQSSIVEWFSVIRDTYYKRYIRLYPDSFAYLYFMVTVILDIDYAKDRYILAKLIWVVMMEESIDDWILNQWVPKNDGKGLWNKRSINWFKYAIKTHWSLNGIEWNEVCISSVWITECLWQDQRESKKHLWIKSNQIKQAILEIDFDRAHPNNEVARHFEDLEYLNTINIQYSKILANVTTRGFLKLYRTEVIDVRFGRSTKQFTTNQFIITSHCQWTWIILPFSNKCTFTEMNGMKWWKIYINHFIRIHSILSIIVEKETSNALLPNVMDCRFGRSMHHSNIQYHINTSNHKWTTEEIIWPTFNCTNLNGL